MPFSVTPTLEWFHSKQCIRSPYLLEIIVSGKGHHFKYKLYAYTDFKCDCVCVCVCVCVCSMVAVFHVFILRRNGFQMTELRILIEE
jgi:hypothetical protein